MILTLQRFEEEVPPLITSGRLPSRRRSAGHTSSVEPVVVNDPSPRVSHPQGGRDLPYSYRERLVVMCA